MSFKSFGLSSALLKALDNENFAQPFPIQTEAIPAILNDNDVLGIAPTGTGKTAGYVLPILTKLQQSEKLQNRKTEVLVLVPTRELAVQVNQVFQQFAWELPEGIKSLSVYGGVSINPQMKALAGVRFLVATPGRLLELVEKNAVNLSGIRTLVLDEADKMLNLGFKEEMNRIFALLPKKRQNLLFSATLSKDVKSMQQVLLHNPLLINLSEEKQSLDLIDQKAYRISEDKKGPFLRHLIKSKNLQQILIFTSSIQRADNVANKLRNNGIEAWPIHSKKSQGARTDLLTKFKHGKLRVLVATDLLARGIDIEYLPVVINYELPRSPKDYIHRIGRTGRAENPGQAISFISPDEEHHFQVIQKKMGQQIPLIETRGIDMTGA